MRVLIGLLLLIVPPAIAGATTVTRTPTLSFSVSAEVGDYDIFEGPLGGGLCLGNARITDPKPDMETDWAADGRRFAFARQTGVLRSDVFVANANGSSLRNVTRHSSQESIDPDWSPDGARIVYVASGRREQLVLISPNGSRRQPVPGTSVDPERQLRNPKWSPDGRYISYQLQGEIRLTRPDGTDQRLLLTNAHGLDWSPDGRRIVFIRDGDLAVASSDGNDVRFLTRTATLLEGGAAWSPDGARIVYWSLFEPPPGSDLAPSSNTYVADADGLNRRGVRGPRGVGWSAEAWRPPAAPVRGTRPCVVRGTARANVLVGTDKGDLLSAGRGNDVVRGRGGDDVIVGDDPLRPRPGRDRLFGGSGNDFIDAEDGRRDFVHGGPGRDRGIWDPGDVVKSIEGRG